MSESGFHKRARRRIQRTAGRNRAHREHSAVQHRRKARHDPNAHECASEGNRRRTRRQLPLNLGRCTRARHSAARRGRRDRSPFFRAAVKATAVIASPLARQLRVLREALPRSGVIVPPLFVMDRCRKRPTEPSFHRFVGSEAIRFAEHPMPRPAAARYLTKSRGRR